MEILSAEGHRDMPCYKSVGKNTPKRVILVFTDVFGIDSGNQKVFCDLLQEAMGDDTHVWMPDLFRGKPMMRDLRWNWLTFSALTVFPQLIAKRFSMSTDTFEKDFTQLIEPKVKKDTGCQSIGIVGFCFGGWLSARFLALDTAFCSCAVQIHPAWGPEALYATQKIKTEMALAERIPNNKPLLLLPSKNDKELKPDSDIVKFLAERRSMTPDELSIEFPDMVHGFVARGDSSDPKIKEAQEKVLSLTFEFLDTHLEVFEKENGAKNNAATATIIAGSDNEHSC